MPGPVLGNRKPQPQAWISFPIGRSGFSLAAVMIRPKNQVRAELFMSGERAKTFLNLLKVGKAEIEGELGHALIRDEVPSRRDCRVAVYFNDVDPEDQTGWPRQQEWLAKRLCELHGVFAQRVSALDADAAGQRLPAPADYVIAQRIEES